MTTLQKHPRSFFFPSLRSIPLPALELSRKVLAVSLAYLMIPLGIGDLYAQATPPPPPDQQYADQGGPPPPDQGQPPQAYNALGPDQLDQLVAPIALYPDALVAQILAASTYPSEIADADNFLHSNSGASPQQLGQMADGMNWDPSVKALIAFPSVLDNLNRNLDWTSQLGNAYYNQPQDVMGAVQTMRQRAYQAGNLQSNQQIAVQYQPNNIVIAPANPTVVYVPYYNPWVVYGAPIVAYPAYYPPPRPVGLYLAAGIAIGFGIGIAVASWNHWGWGWHSWGCGWGSHTVVYQRNVYISRSVTVVNHGYYGHYDRAPGAVAYNRNVAYHAPNVRPGYTGPAHYNNSRTTVNNNYYNNRTNNNYNRTNNNYHPSTNNNYNRTSTNNNYNHPTTNNNYHPSTNNNYNRPGTNNTYHPPANNNHENYNHPANNNNYHPPANNSHPAPQSHPQSHPNNNSHPSNEHEKAH